MEDLQIEAENIVTSAPLPSDETNLTVENGTVVETPAAVDLVTDDEIDETDKPEAKRVPKKKARKAVKVHRNTQQIDSTASANGLSKPEVKNLLKEIKDENARRVQDSSVPKTKWKALVAGNFVEKGPKGHWYVTPKACSMWPVLFDFDAAPKFTARMKAYESGDAPTPVPARRGRPPKAAQPAKRGRPVKAAASTSNGTRKPRGGVDALRTKLDKTFQKHIAVVHQLVALLGG